MTTTLSDLRQAWRSLRKTPGSTLVILLTLAIGIGANVAIFSVLHAVILAPLPYPDADELVLVTSKFPTLGFDRFWISPPEYHELAEWNDTLEAVGGYRASEVSIAGADEPRRVRAATVTASLFDVLGVSPARGRVFTPDEDVPDGPDVVVLSDELWRGAFGADDGIVGSVVEVNGRSAEVVGVMPAGFDIEENEVQLWVPAQLDPNAQNRGSHFLFVAGRLRDGVNVDQARADLARLVDDWSSRAGNDPGQENGGVHAPSPENHPFQLHPLHEEVVGGARAALMALLGAVVFVLLIACANVANVMLARAEARQREMAIRNSMGASRFRLLRLLFTESLLLAVIGGGVGVLLASGALRVLLAASPESLPRTEEVTLSLPVLGFALGVALVTALLFGTAPAIQLRLGRLGGLLKEGGQRTSSSGGAAILRRSLVVAEMALAVGLAVGAGLMMRSLDHLLHSPAGFDPRNLSSFQLYLPSNDYPEAVDQEAFYQRLLAEVEAVPGVQAATLVSGLPPLRDVNANDMEFEGFEATPDGPAENIDYWQYVGDDYFETMGIRTLAGRTFTAADDGQAPPVAVINQRTAEVFWPDQDPIGRRLRPGWSDRDWFTIIGIVDDVKQRGLDAETGTEVYWSHRQAGAHLFGPPRMMHVMVRSELDLAAQGTAFRRVVAKLDPKLPMARFRSMEEVFGASVSRSRFLTLLLGVFSACALLLAAIGIYGVMAYTVARRAQEMGIRIALGADQGRVLKLILTNGLTLALVGLTVGVGAAWGLTRLLRSLLYQVEATDPPTYAAVLGLLLATALVACLVPAMRATRVNPLDVLRAE